MSRRSKAPRPEKSCATCGRPFTWRKKWARDWEQVRHCSARCRGERGGGQPERAAIRRLLAARRPDASACPSEVARALDPDGWRERMPRVRAVAAKMAAEGQLLVTQGAREVHALEARGPIRLRRGPEFDG